jgi:allantoinase
MVMTIAERTVYSAILDRPRFSWPGGAGLAVWIAVNTEHYEFVAPSPQAWPRVPQPDVQGYSFREYGNRVGFWRVAELLDHMGTPATASLNLGVLERIPEIRKALVERDWAIMSHGVFNTRNIIGLSDEEERAFYDWSVKTVKNLTGRALKGMLTPAISANYATPDLMADAGLTYHADWVNDDQPVPIRVEGGQKFVTVPYTFELNTGVLFSRRVLPGDGQGTVQRAARGLADRPADHVPVHAPVRHRPAARDRLPGRAARLHAGSGRRVVDNRRRYRPVLPRQRL